MADSEIENSGTSHENSHKYLHNSDILIAGQRNKPRLLAAPSRVEGGDLPMDFIIQLLKLAASVVGLATAVVKAMPEAQGSRPETKADRKR